MMLSTCMLLPPMTSLKKEDTKETDPEYLKLPRIKHFKVRDNSYSEKKTLNTNISYACPVNNKISSNVTFVFSFFLLKILKEMISAFSFKCSNPITEFPSTALILDAPYVLYRCIGYSAA